MRKLQYVLSNGVAVESLAQAQASSLTYKMSVSELPPEAIKLTDKQKAKRVKAVRG